MDWDFRGSASSLDVYKYRRQSDRNDLFNNRIISGRSYEEKIVEDNRTKTYAILQESRSDFKNNKLRYFLLIYSENAWKIFNVAVLLCAYILDTCVYTFFIENERSLWLIMLIFCLNLMFTCDVVIIVGLKMSKKWRKTLNLVEPETWRVILDVILAVPYSFLYLVKFDFTVFDLHAIAPLAALIRIYRIIEYFYTKSLQAGSNQWTAFLSQYLTLFILSVHTWTCIWFLYSFRSFDISKLRQSWSISSINLPTETTFEWYFVCAYWSVMFLTTNALGDLYPVTTTERLAASVAILLGFLLTTVVFVGSMTSQFITITTRRSNYVRQLMKIKNHLRLIRMDIDTTNRIISYYKDLWYQKSGVFEPKLMELLPCPLRMEICYDLNAVPLYSSLIFRRLPDAFLRRLSLAMSHRFYLPGDIVYDHNHNKTMMVCVTNGVLELLSDEDDETPMVSFTKGTCLGETSLVYNIPARCTVKAATYLECQVLKKTEFIKLMMTYPELVDKMRKEIEERINRCKFKKLERVQTHLLLNVYASTDRKKSRIKSLKDKLRYIQGLTDIEPSKDDKLDDNCLDLYIISEHIKKKTTKFTCINPKFPWILTSGCDLVIYWELYMLLIIFYICLIYPFFIGIKRVFPGGYFFYTEIVITASLVLNIIITCTTAVKTKKKHMDNFWSIVNYRMNTLGFYLDTVAIIPFEYIVTIHNTTYYRDNYRDHLFYLCKGVKLCLIWRLSSFFEALERKLSLNSLIVKISKYCVYICILCYWSGVILYMESCFISRCSEESWFSKAQKSQGKLGVLSKTEYPLLTSLYFATTLLLSVGFGDFTPGDKYDMTIVAFLSLYGVLLVGFCVSEFSAVVTHWSRTKTSFLEVIMTIDKFMKENNMHRAIKTRIMSFYQLQWQYNLVNTFREIDIIIIIDGFTLIFLLTWTVGGERQRIGNYFCGGTYQGVELTGENWLEKTVVPLELRKKVLHQARFKALTSIRLFQVKNKAYVHKLTESARDIILPPGEIVYYGGTVTRELYIIESGYCVVTSKENREAKYGRVIGPGNHLELLALLYGVPAVSTVVTLTHCKLISISYSAYSSALSLFPDMREHDGLLTAEELLNIERQARTQVSGAVFLSHYNQLTMKSQLLRITNTLQDFLQDSFINVYTDYQSKQQSYIKSYKQFKVLKSIAPYLLLPIAIKPDGIFLKTWAIIRVFTAIMLCLLTPIIVSMAPQCTYFNIPETVLECICYADMYLMLHVAFYGSKNQLIYHPYLTAKNYLTKAFTADLLICLPWHAIWKLFVPKHDEGHTVGDHAKSPHKFHCILRMVNISQIYKLYTAFSADSIGALKRAYLMTVLQFLILTLFFLNLYASILITMTCRYVLATDPEDFHRKVSTLKGSYRDDQFHPNGNMVCQLGSWIDASKITKEKYLSPMKVYLLAYYWAATSLCGAGFGDITVQDTRHMILSIFILVHGVMFFGYVYAKIASLKAMADQVETKFLENMKHLELFLDGERVPFSIKKIIMEYWKYQWKRTGGWSHQSILGKLHANLNEDAVLYMYEKTLREIPLFENVEYSFFRAFAKMLSERYFQKGYMVMRANEVMSKMYIIYRGKVDIITDTNEVEACMGPGGIFGNIKGAYKYLTMSNVTASRNIDLLCIEGAEFYALLKGYPKVLKKVKYSVGTAAKDYVIPTMGSDRCSIAFGSVPLTYEADYDEEEEDDLDIFTVWDSPDRSLAESHGSRSITSVGNVDYAAATFLIFLPHKWFRSSVIPDCKMVIFMEYLTLFLAYIEFMILVYQMAFLSNPYFLYISVVTDCIFLYKIFLDVHTGYMNRYGDYVLHPKKVRHMYFSKVYHRRRDFLANFTVCYLVFALNLREPMNTAFFCYLRAPQLLRISYLFTYRMHRKINIGSANLFVKLTAIVIWASILSHVNACLFFKLSCLTPEQCNSGNWMSKEELNLKVNYSEGNYFPLYIASLWYMLNLITITGMGDVSAQNDFEVVETIIIVIVIKFCTGLLISEMSAMITAHSSSLISYDYRINELKDGLRDMDLSDHQLTKMWDYVRELWNRQQGRQVPKFIHKLPFRLHCQVMHAVYGGHIKESVIFSKTDEHFRRMLSMWMTHCVFFPGNYIVQCGDSDQCIYFIHRGEVEVLTVHPNLTEYIYDILGPEDSFGIAQGLFVGVAHHFSFRARTVVDIVYLKLDDWKYLLDFYPKSAKIVQKKVANVYLAI